MFDGMLGTWNTTQVYLELRDDTKPVFLITYSVQRLHKAMLRKESERLVILVVLEHINDFEWGDTSFAQPKVKINQVRFLSNLRNLNSKLKYKLYPMPKIREMLLN